MFGSELLFTISVECTKQYFILEVKTYFCNVDKDIFTEKETIRKSENKILNGILGKGGYYLKAYAKTENNTVGTVKTFQTTK